MIGDPGKDVADYANFRLTRSLYRTVFGERVWLIKARLVDISWSELTMLRIIPLAFALLIIVGATPIQPVQPISPGIPSMPPSSGGTPPSSGGTPPPPSIAVNGASGGTTVTAGGSMSVAVANGPGNTTDWMGVCSSGVPISSTTCSGDGGYSWDYLNCTHTAPTTGLTSATCGLTAPSTAGNYNAIFFSNNTYNVLASAPFQVTVPPPSSPSITVNGANSGTTVTAGATITVAVTNGSGAQGDWMGICNSGVTPGSAQCDELGYAWDYLNCTHTAPTSTPYPTSGSCSLTAPSVAGNYVAVFFQNGSYSVLASAPFSVAANTPPPPPPPRGVVANDNDPNVIYSRLNSSQASTNTLTLNWTAEGVTGAYNGDDHYSNVTRNPSPGTQVYGASVTVNFNGTGITWIGRTGPNFGIAAYSVDGGPVATFDAYSTNPAYQTPNVPITGLASGSHSLKIEVMPNKNSLSSDYYQVIDAFVIQGSGTIGPSTSLGSLSMPPFLTPSGGWGCGTAVNNASDISGSHCYQSGAAQSGQLSWNWNGSLIEVYGRPDAENGYANIYIDGTFIKATDWVYGTIDDDLINAYNMFTWKGAPGNHNITIVATGTTDSALNNWALVQIDDIMVFP